MVIGILGLLVASTGCAGLGDHYTVAIDPAFSVDEQASAVAAADEWTAASPVRLDVTVAACSGVHDGQICIHASDATTLEHVSHRPGSLGYTWHDGDGAEVWIAVDSVASTAAAHGAPWLTEENFAHELGHAMGLEHEDGIGALMNSMAIASSRGPVTVADAAQWSRLRGH